MPFWREAMLYLWPLNCSCETCLWVLVTRDPRGSIEVRSCVCVFSVLRGLHDCSCFLGNG